MAAPWRGASRSRAILSSARHARCPQRCAGARGSASASVVRSDGRTFARLGGHSPGAQAIHPPSKLGLRRELVRDYRCDRIARASCQRVGGGISKLRLHFEQMPRCVRALHATRLGRHERSGMRSGAREKTRGLGLQLRSARQLGRQAALLSRLASGPAFGPMSLWLQRQCGFSVGTGVNQLDLMDALGLAPVLEEDQARLG